MMTRREALDIIGARATRWELLAMRRALSVLNLLNTPEENRRLEATEVLLAPERKNTRHNTRRKAQ